MSKSKREDPRPWVPWHSPTPPSPTPGALRPVLRFRGDGGPAHVQVLLQHLLPKLRHLRLPVLLLLPQPPLPCQPLLLLVGALDQQGRGGAAARQREDAVVGQEAGHGVVGGGCGVQGVLHGLRCLQARLLQLLCGGEKPPQQDLSTGARPMPPPSLHRRLTPGALWMLQEARPPGMLGGWWAPLLIGPAAVLPRARTGSRKQTEFSESCKPLVNKPLLTDDIYPR